MMHVTDSAWKFGCGRYLQGERAMEDLRGEMSRIGGNAYVLAGNRAWRASLEVYPWLKDLETGGFERYSGPCTIAKAQSLAESLRQGGYSMLVGFGGGRVMDLVKLAGHLAGVKVICVPTVSGTSAAFTSLSVMYSDKGSTEGTWYHDREVEAVIADTTILSRQPMRYMASGIMDSMAKACEIAHHGEKALEKMDMRLASSMAKHVFDRLNALYPAVLEDITARRNTPAVEEAVYLVIAATGMISGTAKGCLQTAVAHALYEEARHMFPEKCAASLHGEIVALGLKYQTRYTGIYEEEIAAVSKALGIPKNLKEIGLDRSDCAELAANMALRMSRDGKEIDTEKLTRIMEEDQ